ncbi:AbiH family protein [Xylanibacter oryzae]|uniref:AbiH family protein n=1 Tax=Xylanibacter oryzae TaxID=185293 RepID=UPI0004AE2347|nr:AbiH family protein [Xylanibacter oryzae]
MNRIVLVGNGFDLAHNLPTKYEDFINWYWGERIKMMYNCPNQIMKDNLCSLEILNYTANDAFAAFTLSKACSFNYTNWNNILKMIIKDKNDYKVIYSPLFGVICKSIETRGWIDIENEYYNFLRSFLNEHEYRDPCTLNNELDYIKTILIEYLKYIQDKDIKEDILNQDIKTKILEPIKSDDISVDAKQSFDDFEKRRNKLSLGNFYPLLRNYYGKEYKIDADKHLVFQLKERLLPDRIMLLNFNYTKTADMYLPLNDCFKVNHIHGNLENPNSVIFGYGDELDINYKELSRLNDNEYLRNIKSIKYLESSNYRNVLSFIESEPYQIYIMGHSCGNSDRTLLNTLFEHNNCVSIKPFYYKSSDGKDNYLDIVQNISRNFTDMKLMRDRVVNKTYCEPLPQNKQISVQEV